MSYILIFVSGGLCWQVLALISGQETDPSQSSPILKMQQQVNMLSRERDHYRQLHTQAKNTAEIDKVALNEIKNSLSALQEETSELREEAAFYRSIASPAHTGEGARVQSFRLLRGSKALHYPYRIVLTQYVKKKKVISGGIEMTVVGSMNGKEVALPLKKITEDQKKQLKLRYRYFQKVQGELILPKGFSPSSVLLKIKLKNKKSFEKRYLWADTIVKESLGDTQNVNT